MIRLGLIALSVLGACGHPVTTTYVQGTVRGAGFSAPQAVWNERHDFTPRLLLIADAPDLCSQTFGEKVFVNGLHVPSLLFDEKFGQIDFGGDAGVLLKSTASSMSVQVEKDGKLRGSFLTDFGPETIAGDFVATRCTSLTPSCGCSIVGFAAPVLALGWLFRSKRRRMR